MMSKIHTHLQTILKLGSKEQSHRKGIDLMYSLLSHTEELQRAKEKLEKEKQELERRLREVKVIEINGIKVGISTESLAPRHSEVFQRTGSP